MISEQKVQISVRQFLMLSITYVISTADVFLPAFIAQESKEDSWIAVIVGTIAALIVVNIFITLGLKFPGKTIVQYSCDILGKPLGKVMGFLYAYFFLLISWAVARELEEIYVIAFNPESPILIYGIIAIIVCAYCLKHGLEVLARLNEILLPIGMIILAFIAVVNLPQVNFSNYLPVFYNGFIPSLRGGLLIQTWLSETVILLMLIPFIREKQKIRKYLNISIIILSFTLMTGVLTIGVFGATLTSKLLFPALEYVRYASLGPQIQNLDISIMIVWTSGIFVKIALSYYAGTLALSQLFGFKSYKSLLVPIGILIVVFASISSRMLVEMLHFLKYDIPIYFFVMSFVFPLLLLIVSIIRKNKLKKQNTTENLNS
jgi:spore germination protein KB